jgi:hypothetical protein
MTLSRAWGAIAAVTAILTAAVMAAPAQASDPGTPLLVKSGGLARDCIGEATLDARRPDAIRFIVWCSVQSGEARFSLRRAVEPRSPEAAPINAVSTRPASTGPGADKPFRCRLRGRSVQCSGRKSGPVVVRGLISVPADTRCAPLNLRTAGTIFMSRPIGCPGTHPYRPRFRLGYMRGFREQFGLDEDLRGDRAAIDRRIRGTIRAWRRGEPVARVTASEIGMPLRPVDARRLEFRDELLDRTVDALEHWVPRHAADTYAGYWLDDEHGAILYVGFTGDQDAQLAAFKRSFDLFAPGHIRPFPVPPRYSEAQLERFAEEVVEPLDSPLARLVNSVGVVYGLANKVEIGTEHVARVRRLLVERFGTDDPFLVVFERPGVLL